MLGRDLQPTSLSGALPPHPVLPGSSPTHTHTPKNPARPSTLLDCLWPQANRKVVPLIWALLKEAADNQAHFSDRETEPEQPRSNSGSSRIRMGCGVGMRPRQGHVPCPNSSQSPRVQTVFLPQVMPFCEGGREDRAI